MSYISMTIKSSVIDTSTCWHSVFVLISSTGTRHKLEHMTGNKKTHISITCCHVRQTTQYELMHESVLSSSDSDFDLFGTILVGGVKYDKVHTL